MGTSFFELIIAALLLLGGSMGIPMGVPPGESDPVMYQVAPEKDCVLYASWVGVGKVDPNANQTEKWISQPAVLNAVFKLRKAYRGMLLNRGNKRNDPLASKATEIATDVLDVAATNPTAMYLTRIEVNQEQAVDLQGAVVVSLGDQADAIGKKFQNALALIQPPAENAELIPLEVVQINGKPAVKFNDPNVPFSFYASVWENYFVIGLGKNSLEELAQNWKTPQPKWLSGFRERLNVERESSVAFINAQKLSEDAFKRGVLFGFFGYEPIKRMTEEFQSVAWVSGLDRKGFLTRTEIQVDRQKEGVTSIFAGDPIPEVLLEDMPADSMVGFATRLSTENVLKLVRSAARDVEQQDVLDESLQSFHQLTGVRLEKELADAVGDFIYVYYDFDMANMNGGWLVSIRIDDEMSFPSIYDELNKGLKNWTRQQDGVDFVVEEVDQYEIYSILHQNRQWNNFAWALIDEQWYFARSAAEIRQHLNGEPKDNQLAHHGAIQEMLTLGKQPGLEGPIAVSGFNFPRILKLVHPFLAGMLANGDERITPEMDFTWGDIPKLDELVKDVHPNYSAVYKTDLGFQVFQRQTYPAASPPVSLLAASAAALPMALASVDLTQRNVAEKRLRQLALAMHNFESAYRSFPAAYSTDKNGNPLLSWRVHILPFLGEGDLHSKFKLDEPWDSDHNKKLIKRMPAVFKNPSMELVDGKTAYLVPTGDNAIFGAPTNQGENPPQGVGFGKITDGSSMTAMIVEVNKEHSVFWTRPVDMGQHGGELSRKTSGIRKGDEFCMALGDGSVIILDKSVATGILDNLLKRNDGNVFHVPRGR